MAGVAATVLSASPAGAQSDAAEPTPHAGSDVRPPTPGVMPRSQIHIPGGTIPPRTSVSPPPTRAGPPPPTQADAPLPPRAVPSADAKRPLQQIRPVPVPRPQIQAATPPAASAGVERVPLVAPAEVNPPPTPGIVSTPAASVEESIAPLQPDSPSERAAPPPSGGTVSTADLVQVAFDASGTNLDDTARSELKSLADRLGARENLRLQLLAYAQAEGQSASQARRMSLSRALSVRSYLIENGINTSRIDVRALGNTAPSAPLDRVDVKVVQR